MSGCCETQTENRFNLIAYRQKTSGLSSTMNHTFAEDTYIVLQEKKQKKQKSLYQHLSDGTQQLAHSPERPLPETQAFKPPINKRPRCINILLYIGKQGHIVKTWCEINEFVLLTTIFILNERNANSHFTNYVASNCISSFSWFVDVVLDACHLQSGMALLKFPTATPPLHTSVNNWSGEVENKTAIAISGGAATLHA